MHCFLLRGSFQDDGGRKEAGEMHNHLASSARSCDFAYLIRQQSQVLMKKSQVLKILQAMPDEFPVDALIEKLMLLQKIEEGQKQVQAGQVYTEEEAKKKLEKWLK
jgi:predicted transcriptional regulator